MKEPNNPSFSQRQYEQLIGHCALQNAQNFANLNMAAEIANAVLLMLLKQSQTDGSISLIQDNVQALYPIAVEEVFASFQRKIFQSCFAKTRDAEISHDIAQETILQLLGSQVEIKNVPAWMNSVSHNLLCQHYEAKAGDSTLYEELIKQDENIQNAMDDTDSVISKSRFRTLLL